MRVARFLCALHATLQATMAMLAALFRALSIQGLFNTMQTCTEEDCPDFDTPPAQAGDSRFSEALSPPLPDGSARPFYILSGVVISVQARATVRAQMPRTDKPLATITPQPEQVWLV